MSKLYYINHSKALDGFYMSAIFVVAANKEQAKEKIRNEAKRLISLKDNTDDDKFEGALEHSGYIKYDWNDYVHDEIDENLRQFFLQLELDMEHLTVAEHDCLLVKHSG